MSYNVAPIPSLLVSLIVILQLRSYHDKNKEKITVYCLHIASTFPPYEIYMWWYVCKSNTNKLHTILVNGGYSSWSSWGSCSKSCGTGSQSKSRSCNNPAPQHGGASCSGSSSATQNCNTHNCPSKLSYFSLT